MTWHEVDTSGWRPDRIWAVDENPEYITEWHCEPPAPGTKYRVRHEEWGERQVKREVPFIVTVTIEVPGTTTNAAFGTEPPLDVILVRRIYAWE